MNFINFLLYFSDSTDDSDWVLHEKKQKTDNSEKSSRGRFGISTFFFFLAYLILTINLNLINQKLENKIIFKILTK